jgi:hypothetical protein
VALVPAASCAIDVRQDPNAKRRPRPCRPCGSGSGPGCPGSGHTGVPSTATVYSYVDGGLQIEHVHHRVVVAVRRERGGRPLASVGVTVTVDRCATSTHTVADDRSTCRSSGPRTSWLSLTPVSTPAGRARHHPSLAVTARAGSPDA